MTIGETPAPELSAIVLCYRAEEHIREVFEPLYACLCAAEARFEVVLVANYDAGGPDRTAEVTAELARTCKGVRHVAREKEGGMGWDMRSGLSAARGSVMIVIDGDGQNPPGTVLDAYYLMLSSGADVLKGRRHARGDGLYRRFISFGYNVLFRLLFSTRGVWDINGKPKGLTRSAYEQMRLSSNDWFIDAEIVITAHRKKLRIVELPVVFEENAYRESFVRFGAVWEFIRNLAVFRLGRRR
jgi:glycosyltransferase involved in cell wall biosynthesis